MRILRTLGPLAVVCAATGCFATREDVRVLQSDVAVLRAEAQHCPVGLQVAVVECLPGGSPAIFRQGIRIPSRLQHRNRQFR